MQKIDERRRITVDRRAFNHYEVPCPFCGENVGPRFVTREHLDIPPNPPYAATVRCPRCQEELEVLFGASYGAAMLVRELDVAEHEVDARLGPTRTRRARAGRKPRHRSRACQSPRRGGPCG